MCPPVSFIGLPYRVWDLGSGNKHTKTRAGLYVILEPHGVISAVGTRFHLWKGGVSKAYYEGYVG